MGAAFKFKAVTVNPRPSNARTEHAKLPMRVSEAWICEDRQIRSRRSVAKPGPGLHCTQLQAAIYRHPASCAGKPEKTS